MPQNESAELGLETLHTALKSAVIAFDADQMIRALCFHLLDDHYAARVSALSIHHTRDRLRRHRTHAAIARRQWEMMTNRERFEWLLARSKSQIMFSGDTVSLMAQK